MGEKGDRPPHIKGGYVRSPLHPIFLTNSDRPTSHQRGYARSPLHPTFLKAQQEVTCGMGDRSPPQQLVIMMNFAF